MTLSQCHFEHAMSSTSGNDLIYSKMIVAVDLQFSGCGDIDSSLAHTYGTSNASAHCVVEMFPEAVDKNESCQAMQVKLPRSIDELKDLAQHLCDV